MHPLAALISCYSQLLKIPYNDSWRIRNQELYSTICHEISELTDIPPEYVQSFCEQASSAIK